MTGGAQGQFQVKYELFGWVARVKITGIIVNSERLPVGATSNR